MGYDIVHTCTIMCCLSTLCMNFSSGAGLRMQIGFHGELRMLCIVLFL